jgi:hypothetical protein
VLWREFVTTRHSARVPALAPSSEADAPAVSSRDMV